MTNNKIRIEYNPYTGKIGFQLLSGDTWENFSEDSPFARIKTNDTTLQNVLEEVIKSIKYYDYSTAGPMEIVFCGTEEDFYELKEELSICYEADNSREIPVLIMDPNRRYDNARNIAAKVDDIFKTLQDDLEKNTNPDIKNILLKYSEATSTTIPLCVVGTYSAGKSAFINALIGQEILPSHSKPTTAKIFKITPDDKYRIYFEYDEQKVDIIFNPEGKIQVQRLKEPDSVLSPLLKAIADDQNPNPSIMMARSIEKLNDSSLPIAMIDVRVPFVKSTLPINSINFEIYDTPGSNTVSHNEHIAALTKALNERSNGLPILLTDIEKLDAKDTKELTNFIDKNKALDRSNVIVVINKADQKSISSLQELKDEKIASVVTEWKSNRFIFLSSAMAIGCKKSDDTWLDADCQEAFEDSQKKFYQYDKNNYKVLPSCNRLPRSRYNMICSQAHAIEIALRNGNTSKDVINELIAHNCGIRGVENEIAYFAERHANNNKCKMASQYLQEIIDILTKDIDAVQKVISEKRNQLMVQFEQKYQLLNKRIETEVESFRIKAQETASAYIQSEINSVLLYRQGKTEKEIKNQIKEHRKDKYKDDLNTDIKETLDKELFGYQNIMSEKAQEYWNNRSVEIQGHIISIIKESDGISAKEKETLISSVANYPSFTKPSSHFDLYDSHFGKFKYIKQVKNIKKEVKREKIVHKKAVVEKGMDIIQNQKVEIGRKIAVAYVKHYEKWIAVFQERLTKDIENLNPTLHGLRTQIIEKENELHKLENQINKYRMSQKDISNAAVISL